jgi:5-methylcytosine-specific restriction endonuclease McrA
MNIQLFPIWKPLGPTIRAFKRSRIAIDWNERYQLAYKPLRNSSSCFIKKPEVRNYILARDGNRCKKCGSEEFLQIDHIISVYACVKGLIPFEKLNHESNLQVLCRTCNSAKNP